MDARALALAAEPYVIDMRRQFHMHPELPLEEEWTSQRIQQELESMAIPYEVVGRRNVIGWLDGGSGSAIVLRADIDALPIEELLDLPYRSRIPGKMHACGHDAHAAMVLGAARALSENRSALRGKVYFVFQCAEEMGLCADECVAWLKARGDVKHAFGIHLSGEFPAGTLDLCPGSRYAGGEIFRIDISGQGGHGSRPDLVVDPIRVACDIYMRITSIPSNRHSLFDTCVVSPCLLSGGSRFNVFPDTAVIEGTVRYFKPGDGAQIVEKLRHFAEKTAEMYGAQATVTTTPAARSPVVNDPELTAVGRRLWEGMGLTLARDSYPTAGSDNFADFLEAFPGFYATLGSRSPLPGTSNNLHSARFCVDETCLRYGVEFFLNCVDTWT